MLAAYYASAPTTQEEIDIHQLPGADNIPIERRRRSSRHGRRAMRIHFRLPDLSETGRSAYPEPPVNAREAFNAPVYPAMEPMQDQEEEFDHEGVSPACRFRAANASAFGNGSRCFFCIL